MVSNNKFSNHSRNVIVVHYTFLVGRGGTVTIVLFCVVGRFIDGFVGKRQYSTKNMTSIIYIYMKKKPIVLN